MDSIKATLERFHGSAVTLGRGEYLVQRTDTIKELVPLDPAQAAMVIEARSNG
jgi:hypothetical protein